MQVRLALSTLGLTVLLAACGNQQAITPAQGAAPTTARTQPGQAPVLGTANPEAISGQYIVVFSAGAQGDLTAQDASSLACSAA